MFYLFANCNFVPDRYDDWQAAYDDLAEHVYADEQTTQTYYFGIPIDYADDFSKTTGMLAFEVYGAREDLYKTHFSSAAMAKFLAKIPPTMPTGLDLAHYSRVGGFLDLPGDLRECAIMQDTRVECKSPEARAAVVARLRELTDAVESEEERQPTGIFTYMAFESLDDDVGVRLFGRFESRAAMEAFLRRADVIGFWMDSKEDIARMDCRGYLPNKKGWLHR